MFCVGGLIFDIWETQPWNRLGNCESPENSVTDVAVNCICCAIGVILQGGFHGTSQ